MANTALMLDKDFKLTIKENGGAFVEVQASNRLPGSVSVTENPPIRSVVVSASGVLDDTRTRDPEVYGTVTATVHVPGADYTNTSTATIINVIRALLFKDATKIPGATWTTTFNYPQSGGCGFYLDLEIETVYCSGGADVTRTLNLGAVKVIDAFTTSFTEDHAEFGFTAQLLEEPDFTAWT